MTVSSIHNAPDFWRLVVVGGCTPSVGKTQLVCDVLRAFPKVNWIAGKITEAGDGVCTLNWVTDPNAETESGRFLVAGAARSFWLRYKQGSLRECLAILAQSLADAQAGSGDSRKKALIVESDSLVQFVKPSLYFAVIDPDREDFTESAQTALERANALVLRRGMTDPTVPPALLWMKVPPKLLQQRPSVLQSQGEPLPRPLESLIHQMLDDPPSVSF
jgi:hypothetical protein